MKLFQITFVVFIFCQSILADDQAPIVDRTLVWSDEFDSDRLDDQNWIYEQHCGRFNQELECYTKHREKNVRIENGHLMIEVCVEPYNGYNFTSGRLLTRKSWKYGRFEIRARMPHGYQLWPAIWMLAKHETDRLIDRSYTEDEEEEAGEKKMINYHHNNKIL